MNYFDRKSVINNSNDGNHVNKPPERYEIPHNDICGFCGEVKEQPECTACNQCLADEYIKDYINGK